MRSDVTFSVGHDGGASIARHWAAGGVGFGNFRRYVRANHRVLPGWIDDIIMRAVDVMLGFPTLLVALFVLFVIGGGYVNLVLVLALTRWMIYARVARGMTMSLREEPFIEGVRVIGASDFRIITRHLWPNLLSPVLVLATLEVARLILAESALSFWVSVYSRLLRPGALRLPGESHHHSVVDSNFLGCCHIFDCS